MCTIDNIKRAVVVVNSIKLIMALFVVIIGGIFAANDTIHKSYGIFFMGTGTGILFLGLFSAAVVYPLHYSIKRHNKFVMICCFFVDTLVLTQVIYLGKTCYDPTIPIYSGGLEADCLRHSPLIYTEEECLEYLNSDRTSGFRLAWAAIFNRIGNPDYFQLLTSFEDENLCCGFGPPLVCRPDDRPFPSDRPTDGVMGYMTDHRTVCGPIENYYRQQGNCLDYFNVEVLPPIVGGCIYDMGGGTCLEDDLTDASKGCADVFEAYVKGLVKPFAVMLMGSSFTNLISMILACCMCWKRKETDTFPDFLKIEMVNVIIIASITTYISF
jgi:hypothetical protein